VSKQTEVELGALQGRSLVSASGKLHLLDRLLTRGASLRVFNTLL